MAIINGTPGNDTLTGTTGSEEIYGFAGDDTLHGGGTATVNDFDYLDGGAGNDTLIIQGGGAALGGAGDDVLRFVGSNPDIDFMDAEYSTAQQGIFANLTAVARGGVADGNNTIGYAVSDGQGGVDRLIGVHEISDSQHDDTFFVDQTYDNSYNGYVSIELTAGNDTVNVLGGADVLVVYRDAGGAVRANLQTGIATDRVQTNHFIGHDRLIGVTDLRGSAFGDLLTGNGAANQIRGRQGNDTIYGLGGNDRLYGDNRQNDSMKGNDILDGGAGNDELDGGRGNDRLIGGKGKDQLTGDSGFDKFVFNNALTAANVDRITDFNVAQDTIQLDNAVMAGLGRAMNPGEFWKSASGLAHDGNDRIIYETDTGWLNYDSNGSARGGAVHIAKLAPHLALTHLDFVVI